MRPDSDSGRSESGRDTRAGTSSDRSRDVGNARGRVDDNRHDDGYRDDNRRDDNDRNRNDDRRYRDDDRYRDERRNDHVRRFPQIRIDIGWPWVHRHQRNWSPRYRFRQIVHVNAGWQGHRRDSNIDVRTYYRHRVRDASSRRAEVDVFIDRIELYDNGYFIGAVDRIPSDLAHVRAVIGRYGGIEFDRQLFLVGDPYVGFEMISTRHYDGYLLDRYQRSHGMRVGVVDLRRERVVETRRSRLFDPFEFGGLVPVSLLPRDGEWLADYGDRSPSRQWYGDDDRYYYGQGDLDDYDRFDDDRTSYSRSEPGINESTVRSSRTLPQIAPLKQQDEETYTTEDGAEIRLKRETTLERVE